MGGFLCAKKEDGEQLPSVLQKYQRSLRALEKRGLNRKDTIDRDRFTVFLFDKSTFPTKNVVLFENGDFVASTGTLIYKRRIGEDALRCIYNEGSSWLADSPDLYGHFCVLLFRDGRLLLFNDYNGCYHVFHNEDLSVVSSSFLAVLRSIPNPTLNLQELVEYVGFGATYGGRTLFSEVLLLDSLKVHQLLPSAHSRVRSVSFPPLPLSREMSAQVSVVAGALEGYFRNLANLFGNDIGCALSGGFDTRLMLAVLRKVGVQPSLYVYGSEQSRDVRVARAIAKAEGFAIRHVDKDARAPVDPEQFPAIVDASFHFNDGRGIVGVFDSGADLESRRERATQAKLAVNGGGGEIYRDFWRLTDRRFTVRQFVNSYYEAVDFTLFTDVFNRRSFLQQMASKIKLALATDADTLSRGQVEQIYPLLRLRYWMGQNNGNNATLSYALTPFSEPLFTQPSGSIPMRRKVLGAFEAALIRHCDPALARHQSEYGFNFIESPSWKELAKAQLIRRVPCRARPILRQYYRRHAKTPFPYWLTPEWLRGVVNLDDLRVARYLHIDRVRNPSLYSRVLTVELLLQDAFAG